MPFTSLDHPASWDDERLLQETELKRQRRSGPGGQHRNKVETGIVATFLPTGARVEATERRSQEANRVQALYRLRLRLAVVERGACDPAVHPTALWIDRRQGNRIRVNVEHAHFPALLAEALDVTLELDDAKTAADSLGVSVSQLAKFIGMHPPALALVNEMRAKNGLRPLKV